MQSWHSSVLELVSYAEYSTPDSPPVVLGLQSKQMLQNNVPRIDLAAEMIENHPDHGMLLHVLTYANGSVLISQRPEFPFR